MPPLPQNSLLYPPEGEFLLACCRSWFDSEQASFVVSRDLDWDLLFHWIRAHHIAPIVYDLLKGQKQDLPEPFWVRLEGAEKGNWLQVRLLEQELCRILKALAQAGIDGLPFKGCALAHGLYPRAALRSAGDIDLFIRRQDLRQAQRVLENLHYESVHGESQWEETGRLASSYSLTLQRTRAPEWSLDLHWDIARRHFLLPFDFEALWSRREVLQMQGRTVPHLGLEDQFFYLSLHGSKHRWERLQWLLDLALLMRHRKEIDWANLRERAAKSGVLRMTALGLGMLHALWEIPIPSEFESPASQDSQTKELLAEMQPELFQTEGHLKKPRPEFTGYLQHLRLRERSRDQWRIVLRALFQPGREDYRLFGRLPFSPWLMLLLRPFRLALHHGSKPFLRLAAHFLGKSPARKL